MSKQIEALRKLGLTDEEIQQVLDDDKRIDKGEKLFELSTEQEKASKQARQVGTRKVDAYGKTTERKRKANTDKQAIINALDEALCRIADQQTEVTNPEREIIFHFNGVKYKVVLSAPRS